MLSQFHSRCKPSPSRGNTTNTTTSNSNNKGVRGAKALGLGVGHSEQDSAGAPELAAGVSVAGEAGATGSLAGGLILACGAETGPVATEALRSVCCCSCRGVSPSALSSRSLKNKAAAGFSRGRGLLPPPEQTYGVRETTKPIDDNAVQTFYGGKQPFVRLSKQVPAENQVSR